MEGSTHIHELAQGRKDRCHQRVGNTTHEHELWYGVSRVMLFPITPFSGESPRQQGFCGHLDFHPSFLQTPRRQGLCSHFAHLCNRDTAEFGLVCNAGCALVTVFLPH